ncbi:MAG: hypothetical protein IPM27_12240 [Nitrosomonadales bacterium]|nr:hypothetical protein [Nitrosomonadales bacterium]
MVDLLVLTPAGFCSGQPIAAALLPDITLHRQVLFAFHERSLHESAGMFLDVERLLGQTLFMQRLSSLAELIPLPDVQREVLLVKGDLPLMPEDELCAAHLGDQTIRQLLPELTQIEFEILFSLVAFRIRPQQVDDLPGRHVATSAGHQKTEQLAEFA